jgi:fluoride exporter
VGVAGLGAFTTFSSLARDTVALLQRGQVVRCVIYAAASFVGGLGAAALGMAIA